MNEKIFIDAYYKSNALLFEELAEKIYANTYVYSTPAFLDLENFKFPLSNKQTKALCNVAVEVKWEEFLADEADNEPYGSIDKTAAEYDFVFKDEFVKLKIIDICTISKENAQQIIMEVSRSCIIMMKIFIMLDEFKIKIEHTDMEKIEAAKNVVMEKAHELLGYITPKMEESLRNKRGGGHGAKIKAQNKLHKLSQLIQQDPTIQTILESGPSRQKRICKKRLREEIDIKPRTLETYLLKLKKNTSTHKKHSV